MQTSARVVFCKKQDEGKSERAGKQKMCLLLAEGFRKWGSPLRVFHSQCDCVSRFAFTCDCYITACLSPWTPACVFWSISPTLRLRYRGACNGTVRTACMFSPGRYVRPVRVVTAERGEALAGCYSSSQRRRMGLGGVTARFIHSKPEKPSHFVADVETSVSNLLPRGIKRATEPQK